MEVTATATLSSDEPSAASMVAALGSILDPLPTLQALSQTHASRTSPAVDKVAAADADEHCNKVTELGSILDPLPALESSSKGRPGSASPSPRSDKHSAAISVAKKRTEPDKESSCKSPHLLSNACNDEIVVMRTAKRPRFAENRKVTALRREIAKAAAAVRKEGIDPRTLFFPSLPNELKKDVQLRTCVGVGLEDLKTIQAKGKKMAWATFASEGDCLDRLLEVRLSFPKLKVSLHRPKQYHEGSNQNLYEKNAKIFDRKVQDVLARGGLGNTLMLRNLPVEVDCDELESVLRRNMETCHVSGNPLRVRTALSKGKSGRNFWLVYSGIHACRMAFSCLLLKTVAFRCGKTAKLHLIIHDDSTDADENKRRERALALGAQSSSRGNVRGSAHPSVRKSIDALEQFLRSTQQSFVFLPSRENCSL